MYDLNMNEHLYNLFKIVVTMMFISNIFAGGYFCSILGLKYTQAVWSCGLSFVAFSVTQTCIKKTWVQLNSLVSNGCQDVDSSGLNVIAFKTFKLPFSTFLQQAIYIYALPSIA